MYKFLCLSDEMLMFKNMSVINMETWRDLDS